MADGDDTGTGTGTGDSGDSGEETKTIVIDNTVTKNIPAKTTQVYAVSAKLEKDDKSVTELKIGETATATATVWIRTRSIDENGDASYGDAKTTGDATITAASSDPTVLSVSGRTTVTALKAGSATITVTASYQGEEKSDSIFVTVTAVQCVVTISPGEGDILATETDILAVGENSVYTLGGDKGTVDKGTEVDLSIYQAGSMSSSKNLYIDGWMVNSTKKTNELTDVITIETDTAIVAHYNDKDGSIVIYLNANGGSAPDSITVPNDGSSVTLPTATKAAKIDGNKVTTYTYAGWSYKGSTYKEITYKAGYAGETFTAVYTETSITRSSSSTISLGDAGYPAKGIASDAFTLSMSDNTGRNFFRLMGTITTKDADGKDVSRYYNCITSLSVTGGPEDPFEHLQVVIPKRRLRYVAAALAEKDGIIAGVTRIQLGCMGRGMFTVSKVRYSGRRLTITAYCDAERFRGCTAGTGGYTGTPRSIIKKIFDDRGSYGALFGRTSIEGEDAHKQYESQESLTFDEDANVWYILQVCAMLMRCRIWFADDTMYVRDCTLSYVNGIQTPYVDGEQVAPETVDLYPTDTKDPMWGRVLDDVQLGDEGSDTITNSVTIRCLLGTVTDNGIESGGNEDDDDDSSDDENSIESGTESSGYSDDAEYTVTMGVAGPFYEGGGKRDESESIRLFGEHEATLSIPELRRGVFSNASGGQSAKEFARNWIEYLREPSQSVEFTLKEIQPDGTWLPYFDEPSMASLIKDDADEIYLTNASVEDDSKTMPQKLMLSSHERHWPNCTTTYIFGQMQSISLSDSTSRITSALYKGRWPGLSKSTSRACASAG